MRLQRKVRNVLMSKKADIILTELNNRGIRLPLFQESRCRAAVISALGKIDNKERAERERNSVSRKG